MGCRTVPRTGEDSMTFWSSSELPRRTGVTPSSSDRPRSSGGTMSARNARSPRSAVAISRSAVALTHRPNASLSRVRAPDAALKRDASTRGASAAASLRYVGHSGKFTLAYPSAVSDAVAPSSGRDHTERIMGSRRSASPAGDGDDIAAAFLALNTATRQWESLVHHLDITAADGTAPGASPRNMSSRMTNGPSLSHLPTSDLTLCAPSAGSSLHAA